MTDDFLGKLEATAPRSDWMIRFAQEVHFGLGYSEDVGVQLIAVEMALALYEEKLDTREACRRAIATARAMPYSEIAKARAEADLALRKVDEKLYGSD